MLPSSLRTNWPFGRALGFWFLIGDGIAKKTTEVDKSGDRFAMRSNEHGQTDAPDRGLQGKGKPIRKQVDDLLRKLQPTPLADERRR